jgi:hypothetical protein
MWFLRSKHDVELERAQTTNDHNYLNPRQCRVNLLGGMGTKMSLS